MTLYTEIRKNFRYDPQTGHVMAKTRRGSATAGQVVKGTRKKAGLYRTVDIAPYGRVPLQHVVWALTNPELGELQEGYVLDHIDGDTENNRRENLRLATPLENGIHKTKGIGPSGIIGVSLRKGRRPFTLQCSVAGRPRVHKSFATAREAVSVRDQIWKEAGVREEFIQVVTDEIYASLADLETAAQEAERVARARSRALGTIVDARAERVLLRREAKAARRALLLSGAAPLPNLIDHVMLHKELVGLVGQLQRALAHAQAVLTKLDV